MHNLRFKGKKVTHSQLIPTVLLMVVSLVIACGVWANGDSDTPAGTDPSRVKEEAVRSILDSQGKVIDPNRQLASVASSHEGGFGGWYFSDDKGTVYVFMTDTTKVTATGDAFRAAYSGQHASANIEVVEGAYSLDDLVSWTYQLAVALPEAGVPWKSIGVDHSNNVISIGFVSADSFETAGQVRERLGIPEGAVLFTEIGENRLTGGRRRRREPGRRMATAGWQGGNLYSQKQATHSGYTT